MNDSARYRGLPRSTEPLTKLRTGDARVIWHKIANGVTEAQGNGAGFYGKPCQPGAIIKNDIEYILFLRKGGGTER